MPYAPSRLHLASATLGLIALAIPAVQAADPLPYVIPSATGVTTKALLTVGDTRNLKPDGVTPYRLVGIPDGMGAYDNNNGTFTLLVNHELGATAGATRAHLSPGAFVSKWIINKSTLAVQSGADLIQSVQLWNSASAAYVTGITAFSRFCSADLPAVTAFYNAATGKGTQNRVFMNGEEGGTLRAFAHVVTGPDAGVSWELPLLGKVAFENALACPTAQDKTIVMGMDDASRVGGTTPSEVNIYIGTKTATGTDIEKAGLTNGQLYGLKVTGKTAEDLATTAPYGLGAAKGATVAFTLAAYTTNLLTDTNGAALQAEATSLGVTAFSRVEDGAWDPANPKDFWFVTTDQFDQVKAGTGAQVGRSRLWRVRFNDLATPETGGSIAMMLDGTEAGQMYDNMTIDAQGRILLQEDVGGNDHSSKIWAYNIATGALVRVAQHDPARFGDLVGATVTAPTAPFSKDEESSGIIDVSAILGTGMYLANVQAHYAIGDAELVEGGQIVALYVPQTVAASATVSAPGAGSTATGASTGSTSSRAPFLLPTATGATITSLLTVGDSVNTKPDGVAPYRMVGIPDGLGAYDNSDGTFTLLMNHELGTSVGGVRAHGSKGAFVSKWVISKTTMAVQSGADLIQTVQMWNSASAAYVAGTTAFNRFCSADLPAMTAFHNAGSSKGTQNRLFMTGEEGDNGRAFAAVVTGPDAGTAWELPLMGKLAYENLVACPTAQDKTIVVGLDDSDRIDGAIPSEVNFYIGTKTATGTEIAKAGLTNGTLYGLKVTGKPTEDRNTTAPFGLGVAKGATVAFTLRAYTTNLLTDTGSGLQAEATANGVTRFSRVEDGAWDPQRPNDFYFVTTDRFDEVKAGVGAAVGRSRLWRVRFTNIATPETGGTIAMMLDGTEAGQMYDNLTIDTLGRVLLQEDVGGQAHLGKVWAYSIPTGALIQVAKHDPALFGDLVGGVATPAVAPYNNDEESSGIIDASAILGAGWFLADVQAHYTLADPELVQGGQVVAMYVPTSIGAAPAPAPVPVLVPDNNDDDDDESCGTGSSLGLILFGSLVLVLRLGRRTR